MFSFNTSRNSSQLVFLVHNLGIAFFHIICVLIVIIMGLWSDDKSRLDSIVLYTSDILLNAKNETHYYFICIRIQMK
jgi:hypothetical protein